MKKVLLFTILNFFVQSHPTKGTSNYSLEDAPIVIDIGAAKTDSLKTNYIRYIPLETTDDCLIGGINKVLIKNERIYVADFSRTASLFIFDLNGKFLFKINKRGQGPGEYLVFGDFDIQTNGDIYIFDQHRQKFLIYSPDGKYIQEIKSDYIFIGFCLFRNKMYWSKFLEHGVMYANLAVYDMIDKKTDFLLTDKKYLDELGIANYGNYDFYYSPDSIVYYSPKFSEIIFSIDKDGLHPAIGLKNLKKPSKDMIERFAQQGGGGSYKLQEHFFIENVNIYETDKYITFAPRNMPTPWGYTLLYNKLTKTACFIEDQNIGTHWINGSNGKYFFSVVQFRLDFNPSHKQIIDSREELKNWQEDDNPVIVIFEPVN